MFKSKLIKQSFLYVVIDGINKAVPFLILPIISKSLTPEDFGVATNYNVFVQIASVFIYSAALSSVSVNYFKQDKVEFSKYVSGIVFVGTIALLILTILSLILQDEIKKSFNLPLSFVLLGLMEPYLFMFTSINTVIWRCEEEILNFGKLQISQTLLSGMLTLILVIGLGFGWKGKVEGHLISIIIYGIFSACFLYKKGFFYFSITKSNIKPVLTFTIPLIPHALSFWLKGGVDKLLLSNLVGLSANGLYSVALTMGMIASTFMNSFSNAYTPYLYKNLAEIQNENNKKRWNQLQQNIIKIILLIVIMVAVCYLAAYFIIIFLYDEAFHSSTVFLPFVFLSEFFRGIYLIYVGFLYYASYTKILGATTFTLSCLQILFSYVLIKQVGSMGVVYSSLIISVFTALFIYILVKKKVKIINS